MRGELFSGGTIRISLSDWRHGQVERPGCGLRWMPNVTRSRSSAASGASRMGRL
jgi:hypothetical protein